MIQIIYLYTYIHACIYICHADNRELILIFVLVLLNEMTHRYLSVYAKIYAGVSPETYGVLNMWLPFMSMVAKPLFCSLADHYQAYRTFFIMFLGLALFGWGSFGVLPFFIETPLEQQDGLNVQNWIIICIMTFAAYLSMSVLCCLSDAFAVNQAKKTGTSYGKIRVWGTIGWGVSAILVAYLNDIKQLPELVPGLLLTIFCLVLDFIIVVLWRDRSSFELDKPIADIDEADDCPSPTSKSLAIPHTNKNNNDKTDSRPSIIDVSMKDVTLFASHDNSQLNQQDYPAHLLMANNKDLSCDSIKVISSSSSPLPNNMSNGQTITSVYGTINNNDYINQKNQSANNNSQQMTGQVNEKKIITTRLQLLMLYMVINKRRSLIRFMILFTLAGLLMSMQWVYFFLYLEEIYKDNFTYISSLSMVGQSLLGELPFFIISQKIIDLIGRSNALSFSIATIAIRYLLYIYLLPYSSMYFVILVEALQGPSFGLFYVVMTDIGMDYSNCDDVILKLVDLHHIENNDQDIQTSRRALKATMQGLVSACFEVSYYHTI